jgi:hypothetical protein
MNYALKARYLHAQQPLPFAHASPLFSFQKVCTSCSLIWECFRRIACRAHGFPSQGLARLSLLDTFTVLVTNASIKTLGLVSESTEDSHVFISDIKWQD